VVLRGHGVTLRDDDGRASSVIAGQPSILDGHVGPDPSRRVSMIYAAAACLVAAQALGIYALRTRKADLIFSVFMIVLLGAAVALGYIGAKTQFG
jgi:hypothetical protein